MLPAIAFLSKLHQVHNHPQDELLKYMFQETSNLENITLEVGKNNNAAINLYKKNGFEQCALRKNYYGKEDAILMIKKFGDDNE